jgi:hypothetical protein
MSKQRSTKRRNNNNKNRVRNVPISKITSRPRARIPRQIKQNIFSGCDLLVNDLAGATTFSSQRYNINPGLSSIKGLSAFASRYDKYRWRKLMIQYVPKQAVSTTKGMIHLAFDPNPNHGAPSSLDDMSVYEFHDYIQVYGELKLRIAEKYLHPTRWIRCGPVSGDLTLYDAVSCIIGVDAMADTSAVGDVFIHYEIEFSGMQIESTNYRPRSLCVYNLSSSQVIPTSTQTTVEFDELIVDTLQGTLDSGKYSPGCGAFMVTCNLTCNDGVSEGFTVTAEIYKNSAALVPPVQAIESRTTGGYVNLSFSSFVSCDSDDTIEIKVTLVGSIGTLGCIVDACRLAIKCV